MGKASRRKWAQRGAWLKANNKKGPPTKPDQPIEFRSYGISPAMQARKDLEMYEQAMVDMGTFGCGVIAIRTESGSVNELTVEKIKIARLMMDGMSREEAEDQVYGRQTLKLISTDGKIKRTTTVRIALGDRCPRVVVWGSHGYVLDQEADEDFVYKEVPALHIPHTERSWTTDETLEVELKDEEKDDGF